MLHWFCGFVHISQRTVLRPKPALACLCRLVAAAIIFLLTATRDEQLFRALAEAAQNVVDKKGHLEQQWFWWWNIFVFWRVLLLAVVVIPHSFLMLLGIPSCFCATSLARPWESCYGLWCGARVSCHCVGEENVWRHQLSCESNRFRKGIYRGGRDDMLIECGNIPLSCSNLGPILPIRTYDIWYLLLKVLSQGKSICLQKWLSFHSSLGNDVSVSGSRSPLSTL